MDGGSLMPEDDYSWEDKTNFPIGVDLRQDPPEFRYQYLEGRIFTTQIFANGGIVKGEIEANLFPFSLDPGEGWYDREGKFLGDDPQMPDSAWD
jgi:hypothetical protein